MWILVPDFASILVELLPFIFYVSMYRPEVPPDVHRSPGIGSPPSRCLKLLATATDIPDNNC